MKTNNKLREALTRVKKIAASYINCHDDEIDRVMTEIVATCDSAHADAAPPRNCDVGTAEEQGERCLAQFYQWRHKGDSRKLITAIMEWAQMPYEEGGDK